MRALPVLIAATTVLLGGALAPAAASAQAAPTVVITPDPVAPWREGDRTLGAANAPLTLTVYLSTVCSHCAAWHTDEFPEFRRKFVDTGQVRLVFRDLPTPPADLAAAGAVIARCAPDERYDAVLDALFRGQAGLSQEGLPVDQRIARWLVAGGEAGGLDIDQMTTCISDAARFDEIEARQAQSVADGVRGTPTFLLNGERLASETARDPIALEALVQRRLAAQ